MISSVVMTVGLTETSVLFSFCRLPKLPEIMQDKILQLLPHPQCSGTTKWSLSMLCSGYESVLGIINSYMSRTGVDSPEEGDVVTDEIPSTLRCQGHGSIMDVV